MAEKKQKEYTDMQKKLLEVIMTPDVGGDLRKAMRLAGYSDSTPVAIVVNALHEELTEAAKRVIAANSMKATMGMLGIIEDPNQLGAANKIKAAKEVLDRAGIAKKEEKEDINLKVPSGGLVILPAKRYEEQEEEKVDIEVNEK